MSDVVLFTGGGGGGGAASLVVATNFPSYRFSNERYCSGFTAGTISWFAMPDLNPAFNFIAYVKSVWFFASGYGPAPTTSTFQFQARQDSTGATVALHAALTLNTLAMPVVNGANGVCSVPALSAGVQNSCFYRNTGTGAQPNLGILMNVTPGNTGSNPAIGYGVELGILQTY